MAIGDFVSYPQFRLGNLLGTLNLTDLDLTDGNLKVAVLSNTADPTTNWSVISFMDHADINLAAHEVNLATGYDGPIVLITPTAVLNASDIPELRADDYTIPLDAGGFSDGRWIILFYDTGTPATSAVIAYGDLGADRSNVNASIKLDWNNVGDSINTLLRW